MVFSYLDNDGWLPDLKTFLSEFGYVRVWENEPSEKRVHEFLESFTHIRAYHACNTDNPASYYEHGLLPLEIELANHHAKQFILSLGIPDLTPDIIECVFDELSKSREIDQGKVWFELNWRSLVEECGHYLLYGSEYVTAVMALLQSRTGYSCRELLLNRGLPTVFECDIPITFLSETWKTDICRMIIRETINSLEIEGFEPGADSGGICIREKLPPEFIVRHFHPEHVVNPLL